jgi:Family of unknown function (DUF6311)
MIEPDNAQESCRTDVWIYTISIVALAAYILRRLLWLQLQQPTYTGASADVASLVLASAALLLLGNPRALGPWRGLRSIFAGALLGLIFFVATLGWALADPINVAWLFQGDWAAHFIGWHLYRNAPWASPPGAFDTFWYPVGTAIAYTDSLPLLALPLKLVSGLLPLRFQYIGFWLLVNCILQGVFGALLMRCFTRGFVLQVFGAGLFVLAPVFISRIGHDTLTTQWLLLAGLWMYFRIYATRRHALALWLAFAAIAALVHPYLSAMLLALAFAYYLRERVSLALSTRQAFSHLAAVGGVTLLCWWLSGALTLHPSGGDIPLGDYNANLLTWFDSRSLSRWLPALPYAGEGQYEGFGYLGAGALCLTVIALPLALCRKQNTLAYGYWWPLVAVIVALSLFAFSTRLTLGSHILFDLGAKQIPLIGAFRGSGRFIWTSCYALTLIVTVLVAQRAGRFAAPLLALAFFAQLFDLTALHVADARMRTGFFMGGMQAQLRDPYWDEATRGRRHITFAPPPACGKEAAPYFPFSLLAGDHKMTINSGYMARFDETRTSAYCDDLKRELDEGTRFADTLYIVHAEQVEHFRQTSAAAMDCRNVEGYTSCVTLRDFPPR